MNIHSKIDNTILHIIHRANDVIDGRQDITPETTAIQVATINRTKGSTFKAHRHIANPRSVPMTNECWVIIKGVIKADYYDTDNSLLCSHLLYPGDVTITIGEGGHNYTFYEDGLAVEVKNGPFLGVENDKEFI